MATKIIKVFSMCQSDLNCDVNVTVFTDPKLAKEYMQSLIKDAKKQENDLDLDDYTIDEDDTSYERYLTGYSADDSISIWMENDEICEELEKTNDMEKDYDI